ncbi:MAG: hypothetical protein K0S29_881 [Gammaproteobacteria bacterium]|jgi:hypothetical protein|nr:hypothetical protein [Gammaproteobacteria bacterium]
MFTFLLAVHYPVLEGMAPDKAQAKSGQVGLDEADLA